MARSQPHSSLVACKSPGWRETSPGLSPRKLIFFLMVGPALLGFRKLYDKTTKYIMAMCFRSLRCYLASLVLVMFTWIGPAAHGQSQPVVNGGRTDTNRPASQTPAKPATKTPASKVAPGEKININTASVAELTRLPGIGKSKAQAIIDYRTQNGEFKKPEDIEQVKGIKAGLFAKLKDHIELGAQ
jgi:comEA protein